MTQPPPRSTLFPYTTLFRSDHCLVLVGTQPVHNNGKILENALICDPWAKIVCPLAHYSLEWKMKMNKWSNRGLKDRKSTRLNSSHSQISYAVFCLKKKTKI